MNGLMKKLKNKDQVFRCLMIVSIVAFAFLIAGGCAGTSKKDLSTGMSALEPALTQKFPDIPVPRDFTFLPAASYAFKSGNIRVGVLVYSGRAQAEQLISFYQEQMPLYNWNLLNTIEYGKTLLNFDRDNETCVISIEPHMLKTRVTLSIGPKQQAGVKKSEKPIK